MNFLSTTCVPFLPSGNASPSPTGTGYILNWRGLFSVMFSTVLQSSGGNCLNLWTGKIILERRVTTAANIFSAIQCLLEVILHWDGTVTPSHPCSPVKMDCVIHFKTLATKANEKSQFWTIAVLSIEKASDTWSKSSCTDITDQPHLDLNCISSQTKKVSWVEGS